MVRGREFRIGGIVSSVQHRMTKKGSPFGQFTFEDYGDNYTFVLFADTYLKFKTYLEQGWFLYLTGSVQNRWKSEELEFKITNIEYLGDIREKVIKGLELQIHLNDINDLLINDLERLGKQFPGNNILKFNILNAHEDRMINIELLSRKLTVEVNHELIKAIESELDVSYKVLTS